MTLINTIKSVQRRLGVAPDGIPGKQTFAAMSAALDELETARNALGAGAGARSGPQTGVSPILGHPGAPEGQKKGNATWLASALRAAGCKVEELAGWQTRGRGDLGVVRGVLCHHTAGARAGNAPSLNLIVNGRADLPGPLSQLHLARDGTFTVIAAGRCNHAGKGEWKGVVAGNSSFIGIEAENVGTGAEPWPPVQIEAYARGCAAILKHIGAPVIMCAGHKEYARPHGRKIDPAFDMAEFRNKVKAFMA